VQLQDKFSLEPSALSEADVLSAALYPKVFDEYMEFILENGKLWSMPTRQFFVGPEVGEETTLQVEKVRLLEYASFRRAAKD